MESTFSYLPLVQPIKEIKFFCFWKYFQKNLGQVKKDGRQLATRAGHDDQTGYFPDMGSVGVDYDGSCGGLLLAMKEGPEGV